MEGGHEKEKKLHEEKFIAARDIPDWTVSCTDRSCLSDKSTKSTEAAKLDAEVDQQFLPRTPFQPQYHLNCKIKLWRGDITKLTHLDAIVNAARPSLLGGGGIDKAIHAAAGPQLLEACRPLNGCKHGETKITPAFNLPCRYVLHTVGPNRDLHTEEECVPLLTRSYLSCLDLAVENDIKSLALCCISTGAYRYPSRQAAHVALRTVREWLETDNNAVKILELIFCVWHKEDEMVYRELLPIYFPEASQPFFSWLGSFFV